MGMGLGCLDSRAVWVEWQDRVVANWDQAESEDIMHCQVVEDRQGLLLVGR